MMGKRKQRQAPHKKAKKRTQSKKGDPSGHSLAGLLVPVFTALFANIVIEVEEETGESPLPPAAVELELDPETGDYEPIKPE